MDSACNGEPAPKNEELAYRRGFTQGIQFAINSMRDGNTASEINEARSYLHCQWRIAAHRSADKVVVVYPPMSVKEWTNWVKAGWMKRRRKA